MDRETIGRLVRSTWVNYCHETGDTKPSHIAPWEEITDWDREVDCRIGEAVRDAIIAAIGTPDERDEGPEVRCSRCKDEGWVCFRKCDEWWPCPDCSKPAVGTRGY